MTIGYAKHFPEVAAWLRAGGGTIAGVQRDYDQSQWDCGTACCAWGALHLAANGYPTDCGPTIDFAQEYPLLAAIMRCKHAAVRPILIALLEGEDIRPAVLAARAAGLAIYINEAAVVTDQNTDVLCYGTCTVIVVSGKATCYNNCTVTVNGGDVWCGDNCTVTVNDGNVTCDGQCTVRIDGGAVICHCDCRVDVVGGTAVCRDTCAVTVRDGDAECYNNCTVTVHGGRVVCGDRCNVTVHDGIVDCYDAVAVTVNGGTVRWAATCDVTI